MNEREFLALMNRRGLTNRAEYVISWAMKQLPYHYRCFSDTTNRISFRLLREDQNCDAHNAFYTICLEQNDFRCLFNGVGVDMNDTVNWHVYEYKELMTAEMILKVLRNFINRSNLGQLDLGL